MSRKDRNLRLAERTHDDIQEILPHSSGASGSTVAGVLTTCAMCVIVVAGMKAAESIVIPFLLSLFLAIISAPAMFWLKEKGFPTVIAIIIVMLTIAGAGVLISVFIGSSVASFTKDIPKYQQSMQEQFSGLFSWLDKKGIHLSGKELAKQINPGAAMNLVGGMLNSLAGLLKNALMILLTVVFILLEMSTFPAKLRAVSKGMKFSIGNMAEVVDNIKHYMAMKTFLSLATGLIITFFLWMLGVDYPFLWGLLAFLLNFVPNIGSIIAAVPAVMMALIQLGVTSSIMTASCYLVVNLVIGNIIEPRLMGRGMGLSTLVVFLSLVFWGWVLGPVGMLLSVPLTMTVKIALESNHDTRWIALLLSSRAPKESKQK
jgi:AI-2 transport protein TqsA